MRHSRAAHSRGAAACAVPGSRVTTATHAAETLQEEKVGSEGSQRAPDETRHRKIVLLGGSGRVGNSTARSLAAGESGSGNELVLELVIGGRDK